MSAGLEEICLLVYYESQFSVLIRIFALVHPGSKDRLLDILMGYGVMYIYKNNRFRIGPESWSELEQILASTDKRVRIGAGVLIADAIRTGDCPECE